VNRAPFSLLLAIGCVHGPMTTDQLNLSGKATQCTGVEGAHLETPAVGRKVRLVLNGEVLAEDTVNADGTFVLRPRAVKDIHGTPYVETDEHRYKMTNDYASWMQDHIHWHGHLRFGCGDANLPPPAPPEQAMADEPTHPPPPPNLVPH
jgi:hypothetical protein